MHLARLLALEQRNVRTSLAPAAFRSIVAETRAGLAEKRRANLEAQFPRRQRGMAAPIPATERFARELEVLAEAEAYHGVVCGRFVDYLGLFVVGELLEEVKGGVMDALRDGLGVDAVDGRLLLENGDGLGWSGVVADW